MKAPIFARLSSDIRQIMWCNCSLLLNEKQNIKSYTISILFSYYILMLHTQFSLYFPPKNAFRLRFQIIILSEKYRLLPDVCKFLGKQDTNHSEWFVQILVLMDKGDFPVHNICYSLFSDVVQWYSVESTTEIKYMPEVQRFWFIGK